MKTTLGILLLTAAAVAAGAWYWLAGHAELPQFRTLPVTRGELLIGITATGTVEPVEVIDVGAQIMGRIQSFGPDPQSHGKTVDFGSQVKAEAVLATIDDSPYLVELDKAAANLALAQAELSRYRAQLKQAEQDLERARSLRAIESQAEYDSVLARWEMAQADVQVGQARVQQAEIAKQEAELNLGYTTIKSPIDGVVIDRRVNVGQTVVATLNAPSLFLMARDLSRMHVWAAVNEADVSEIHVGQRVSFKVDAYRDRTFEGSVSQIRLNAGMLHNVVTYGVIVDIDNTEGKLLPYMTANLEFEVARRPDALLLPNQALRWQPSWEQVSPASRELLPPPGGDPATAAASKVQLPEPTVWVLAEDGLVRPVAVQVGLSDGMVTELLGDDLQADTPVVVSASRKIQADFVSSFIDKVTKKTDD